MSDIKNQFLILITGLFITINISCKSDNNSSSTVDASTDTPEQAYLKEPTQATGNDYLRAISQKLSDPTLSNDKRKEYLSEGIKIAKEQNLSGRLGGFLYPYIKDNGKEPGIENKLYELGTLMKAAKKEAAANVLFKGVMDMYPNFKSKDEIQAQMTEEITSVDTYVTKLGESIFTNPDDIGVNRKSALQYVDACEAYALAYPESTAAPEFLFKAAEVAKSIQTFPKSLSIYDWLIDKYPNYDKTPTAMFLKGFIIENNLGNDSLALVSYKEFMAKYPNDDLVDDAEFLIQNLGKTDEEILQMIEEKRKSNQK
jgi:tetratricopeptide (TPR) repeat protein